MYVLGCNRSCTCECFHLAFLSFSCLSHASCSRSGNHAAIAAANIQHSCGARAVASSIPKPCGSDMAAAPSFTASRWVNCVDVSSRLWSVKRLWVATRLAPPLAQSQDIAMFGAPCRPQCGTFPSKCSPPRHDAAALAMFVAGCFWRTCLEPVFSLAHGTLIRTPSPLATSLALAYHCFPLRCRPAGCCS